MTYFTKRYHPPGTVPGTLTVDQTVQPEQTQIHLVDFSADNWLEETGVSPEYCRSFLAGPNVTWIHVQGAIAPEMLTELGEAFDLHPLALEDILNVGQRPKAEIYGDQLFVILAMPLLAGDGIAIEQINIFLGENFLVSFALGEIDPFTPIRNRLKSPKGRIRRRGADYLLYTLTDLIIDQGFPVLEELSARVEILEDKLLENSDEKSLSEVHFLKRELLLLRSKLWPHLDVLNQMMRDEEAHFEETTTPYLRDCYDHVTHIIELLEIHREGVSSLQELYLSALSHRMNDSIRTLTVIATIFIPLTFIAGLYGMNFDPDASPWNMPELRWYYGYPLVVGIMLAVAAGLLLLFRRRRWL